MWKSEVKHLTKSVYLCLGNGAFELNNQTFRGFIFCLVVVFHLYDILSNGLFTKSIWSNKTQIRPSRRR